MNHSGAAVRAARRHLGILTLEGWAGMVGRRLSRYLPAYHDWRFWLVQLLIGAIAAAHYIIEARGYLSHFETLYFIPVILFVVPVVYSALRFGSAGSIATVFWVLIIAIPNSVIWHHGLEWAGEASQMLLMVAVAVLVGQQVDRERRALGQAEAAAAAYRSSEAKYHGLFESSPIAALVLGQDGAIVEANPAASILFGRRGEDLKGMPVASLVGTENATELLAPTDKNNGHAKSLVISRGGGSETIYLEPKHTRLDTPGESTVEVLLRDVTQERHRQAGLKAYTAHVLRAQEEERQRIARDLHDDPVQAMALLSMKLDGLVHASGALQPSVTRGLEEAGETAKEIAQGLRDFAKALRPPILDDLGLVTSIRRLVFDFEERTPTMARFVLEGEERRLPQDAEIGLYRITQEALRNVERHSNASRVVVTVALSEGEARLTVNDNGVGFEVPPLLSSLTASGRLGLLGIQERAESLGGKFEVLSSPKAGTTVAVSVPVV